MVLSLSATELKRAVFRNPITHASGQFKSLHLGHAKYTVYYTCYVCANRSVSKRGAGVGRLVGVEGGAQNKSPVRSHEISLKLV